MPYQASGRVLVQAGERDDADSAVRLFRLVYGRLPESVDDGNGDEREVIGMCESCQTIIYDGNDYVADEDLVYLCKGCAREVARNDPWAKVKPSNPRTKRGR